MDAVNIYIKNMVCDRCIMVVGKLLEDAGITPLQVGLGTVRLAKELTPLQRGELERLLAGVGFSLLDSPRRRWVEQVKGAVIELVHRDNGDSKVNLSDYVAGRLGCDYDHVSRIFSEEEGVTVERYFIAQRVERVKELLEYGELSLSEIADLLNYSSAAHLSSQFRKVAGITPSQYRENRAGKRLPLDKIPGSL